MCMLCVKSKKSSNIKKSKNIKEKSKKQEYQLFIMPFVFEGPKKKQHNILFIVLFVLKDRFALMAWCFEAVGNM